MSALFQRLHARGHGGPGATATLKPVPAVYGACFDPAPALDVDAPADQLSPTVAAVPVKAAQAAPASVATSRAAEPELDVPMLPAANGSARIDGTGAAAPDAALRPTSMHPQDAVPPRSGATPHPVSEPAVAAPATRHRDPDRVVEKRAAHASMNALSDPPPPAAVDDMAPRNTRANMIARRSPIPPLERLFAALETPPATRIADAPAASGTPPAPVSIGRIDISVAPPPPPAAHPRPARTQGFASYAGLRRGLER